jgi:hypothetical protein
VKNSELELVWNQSVMYAVEIDCEWWFGHVERKGDDDWVKRCTRMKEK